MACPLSATFLRCMFGYKFSSEPCAAIRLGGPAEISGVNVMTNDPPTFGRAGPPELYPSRLFAQTPVLTPAHL